MPERGVQIAYARKWLLDSVTGYYRWWRHGRAMRTIHWFMWGAG